MTRPECGEGRSVRKDKDATRRLVAKRLAWLAKDSNWDGTLRPVPKVLPPPSSGLKSACVGRRAIGSTTNSPCAEKAPGWDGQVTDITRCATADERAATRKARPDSTPHCDEHNRNKTSSASTAISTRQDGVVAAGMPTMGREKRMAGSGSNIEETCDVKHKRDASLSVRPVRGGNWPATHDDDLRYSEREEEERNAEEGGRSSDDDEDTAAGDYDSNGALDRNEHVSGSCAAHDAASHDCDVTGSAPRTNDNDNDTISELSCSGIFTISSEVGDELGNGDQGGGGSPHDSSSESPSQSRVASPRDDDDDIDASHVEYLIQERRRWKLRAVESEHELAGFQSLRAQMERRDGARAVEPRSAGAIMLQASGSLSESTVSETSTVESGFDVDERYRYRWQAPSGNDRAPPTASSCSTPTVGEAQEPRGLMDTASDAQFSGAASATSDCNQASGVRYDTDGQRNYRHNLLVDRDEVCDEQGQNGDTQQRIAGTGDDDYDGIFCGDTEQSKNGTRTDPLLLEEIAELKENLRNAELRYAAAEATAASVLQRARAAELSRDVKEIQIRNLEIRLARYTNDNKHHKEACAQWRERQQLGGGGDVSADCVDEMRLDLVRQRTVNRNGPPLPTVEEEGEHAVLPNASIGNDRGRPSSIVENHEPNDAASDGRSEKDAVGGLAVGSRRAALDRFRHGCFALGTKAARAGGGAMSMAAAVASEAAKEAVQSATAAVGGSGGHGAAGDRCSQGEIDGSTAAIVEEYWGSDYCTSV